MASEIKVDTVSEKTSANGVAIDGLTIKDGGLGGHDITFADGAYDFDIASHDTSNGLKLGGTLVTATATELNIMDGVTSTAAEINLIDGGTARGTTAIADGDGILINDAGTMRMTTVQTVKTYMGTTFNGIDDTSSSNDDCVTITDNEVVINEDGDNQDFRVESDDQPNFFFCDASANIAGFSKHDRPDMGFVHITTASSGASSTSAIQESDELILEGTAEVGMGIISATDGSGSIYFSDSGASNGRLVYYHGDDSMRFVTNGNEGMRINNLGQIFNNTTSETIGNFSNGARIVTDTANGKDGMYIDNIGVAKTGIGIRKYDASSTCFAMLFKNSANSDIGNITIGGTSTSFNTSSDYRLKENVEYNFDATTRLKQLKPARFNFKEDTDTIVDGFLAHEVSSIVPEAITGEKDAMNPEVLYTADDELPEGKNIGDVKEAETIKPQGIDQSKLVPLLVKTIQELEARITTLEG